MRPCDLGAPERFQSWRPGQDRAFDHLLNSERRWDALALPTGVGKSLLGVLYAKLLSQRTVILTSTKGLMDQYTSLFPELVTDLRGMANYPCKLEGERLDLRSFKKRKVMCDEGPCWDGEDCPYGPPTPEVLKVGCEYYDAWARARNAPIVVTNYALWFSMMASGRDLGIRDVLVCDEAHDAPAQLSAAVGAILAEDELLLPGESDGVREWQITREWKEWARDKAGETRLAMEQSLKPWERRKLRDLERRLVNLSKASGEWVMSEAQDRGRRVLTFEPLWAAPYAEEWLYREVGKVIFLSATITPKILQYLGVKEEESYFLQVPSPFPAARRPVIHVPTVKVNRFSTESEMRIWASRIDQIIRARGDRKGIVHTVSYARAKMLKEMSEHREILLVPRSGEETRAMVEQFRQSAPPKVLVSPAIHTGYDFPYDAARYQVIGKMPFPDNRDPITAARSKADPEYMLWAAITQLVQMTGRVVRAEDDCGETFIVDDTVASPWILKANRKFFPGWWLDGYRSQSLIPRPLDMG